jgi:hypothetical protein
MLCQNGIVWIERFICVSLMTACTFGQPHIEILVPWQDTLTLINLLKFFTKLIENFHLSTDWHLEFWSYSSWLSVYFSSVIQFHSIRKRLNCPATWVHRVMILMIEQAIQIHCRIQITINIINSLYYFCCFHKFYIFLKISEWNIS